MKNNSKNSELPRQGLPLSRGNPSRNFKFWRRDAVRVYRKLIRHRHTIAALFLLLVSIFSYQQPQKGEGLSETQNSQNNFSTNSKYTEQALPEVQSLELDFSSPSPAPLPLPITDYQLPITDLSARAALILDRNSHTILYEKDAHTKLSPASLTKIMTAIVALENFPLDQVVTIKNPYTLGAQMGLSDGERITVENLLWGLLLNSGNDAGYELAKLKMKNEKLKIAAQNSKSQQNLTPVNEFVELMNQKAQEVHLKNTHFTNPIGFDDSNHYSTAYDLALLTKYALDNPKFAEIVATPTKIVSSEPLESPNENRKPKTENRKWHYLKNTNELLGKIEGVTGVKTGWTENAKDCLIVSVNREGHEIIIVILGSQDRIKDAEELIDWTFSNYRW